MSATQTSLPFDPQKVLLAVEEASQLALDLQGNCKVDVKPDATFVTEADQNVEKLLRERLGKLVSNWSVFGEEGGFTGERDAPCWVLDPIDGTNNFVRDLPTWCISVGAVKDGEPIFGVVAVPPLGQVYWAESGHGAYCKDENGVRPLRPEAVTELTREDVVMCNTEAEIAVSWQNVTAGIRNFGSVAYHLAMTARGSACASLMRCQNLYDIAGGMPICTEVGCRPLLLDGRQWRADLDKGREFTPLLVAQPPVLDLLEAGFGN